MHALSVDISNLAAHYPKTSILLRGRNLEIDKTVAAFEI
jgi:hypothetical protein